jgi:hypothetical protein
MKLILGLFLASVIAAVAIDEGYGRYKEWSRHRGPVNRPERNHHHGPGARLITADLLNMSDGETLWHHGRDVTRQGDTWAVDGQTFDDAANAASYL